MLQAHAVFQVLRVPPAFYLNSVRQAWYACLQTNVGVHWLMEQRATPVTVNVQRLPTVLTTLPQRTSVSVLIQNLLVPFVKILLSAAQDYLVLLLILLLDTVYKEALQHLKTV